MPNLQFIELADFRGGRNGMDPPRSLPDNQVVEALNVEWSDGSIGKRRGGAAAVSMTSAPFTGKVNFLFRHLPTANDSDAEVWGVDSAFKIGRYSSGAWATITPTDAVSAQSFDVAATSLNGKLFLAHKSAVDRLHVWDGTTLRRVGLAAPTSAPTSSSASGSVSESRKYQTAVTVQSGGVTLRRSERSPALSVTLSVQQATVTLAGRPSEGETHWELYAASASDSYATYWLIGTAAIGSTITDNNVTVATVTGVVAFQAGTYAVPWSAKFVAADENRLLIAGSYEQSGLASRVGFTPVIGASGVSDDERIPAEAATQISYIDLDYGDGGGITGFGGPMNGNIYVFKATQIYKLVRTGVAAAPYLPVTISKTIGCVHPRTVVAGEDEGGNPVLYFLSRNGPYRIGPSGLQYCGRDIQDLWATINLAATSIVAHGVYYPDRHRVEWWITTGSGNVPTKRIVLDCRLALTTEQGVQQGWCQFDGASCAAQCSAMLPVTWGSSMSYALRPHIGYSGANDTIWVTDTTDQDDNGNAFQAYLLTKPYAVATLGKYTGLGKVFALAKPSAATLYVSIVRDFGLETRTFNTPLAAVASETRVIREFADVAMATAQTLSFQIGDNAAATTPQWIVDLLAVQFTEETASA